MKCLVHDVDQLTPAGTENGSLLVGHDNSKITAVAKRELKYLNMVGRIYVVKILITWSKF